MTSSIGSRPNSSCSKCKCPGHRAPAKHGWTWMSQTALAVRAPSCPWRCETGAEDCWNARPRVPAGTGSFFGVERNEFGRCR